MKNNLPFSQMKQNKSFPGYKNQSVFIYLEIQISPSNMEAPHLMSKSPKMSGSGSAYSGILLGRPPINHEHITAAQEQLRPHMSPNKGPQMGGRIQSGMPLPMPGMGQQISQAQHLRFLQQSKCDAPGANNYYLGFLFNSSSFNCITFIYSFNLMP